MVVINRVDLDKLGETVEMIRKDISKARRTTRLEGEWFLDSVDGPQFRAEVSVERGKFVLEADQPGFLGGGGTRPGPMHYCLYGVAACTGATFATIAATEGIILRRMMVTVESYMDFSKTLGLTDRPIVEEVKLRITVDTDAEEKRIQELRKFAEERCPAVFCLTTSVKMTVEVTRWR